MVVRMELQASRLRARTGQEGEPILLTDQDRGRWDRLLSGVGSKGFAADTPPTLRDRRRRRVVLALPGAF